MPPSLFSFASKPLVIKRAPVSLALLAALTLAGCHSTPAVPRPAANSQSAAQSPALPPAPEVNPATAGTIEGVIDFKGKPPARIPIDMSADPACAMLGGTNLTEQYVVAHGKLANVFVYIKAGMAPSSARPGTPPAVLDQKGCRYVPHVLGVQQGGSVEFRNSDPTTHNVHMVTNVNGAPLDISQCPNGAPQTRVFDAAGLMQQVRCNNHPWMQAFINVVPTPFFAVSGTDGHFRITGLPPGTYTLAAVHEKLGEKDMQITVAPHASATAAFSFGPA